MLEEIWEYLTTPCSKEAKKDGYLYKSIALKKRCERNQAAWQPHIANCHKHILNTVAKLENRNTLVVLGSGLLVEIPLQQLITEFKEIYLIDIVHLKFVRKIAKQNIKKIILKEMNFLDSNSFQLIRDLKPNLTISANLLSQIPDLWAQKQLKSKKTEGQLSTEIQNILRNHYSQFSKLPGELLLFTDYQRWHETGDGKKKDIVETLPGLENLKFENSWTWDLALRPELSPHFDVKMKVGLIHLP